MHALFLVTHTADCEKNWQSWNCIGNTCQVEPYDNRPHGNQDEIVALAKYIKPDVIVYIGAIEKYHRRPVLLPDVLKRLRDVAPSIHIVGDASDKPWWPWLMLYDDKGCFSVQVSIDGSFDTPLATSPTGMIKLTPTDPTPFLSLSWEGKKVFCGMAGGLGHTERKMLVQYLTMAGVLDWRKDMSFHGMAQFLADCKLVVNSPMNGTGDSVHVKGRVIEAGWAGACLLERNNPCTSHWFDDSLYLRYRFPNDAREQIEWARAHDAEIEDMAMRFHGVVKERHHPMVFWQDVLAKAGVL
jgi:hypothetical protein